MEEIIPTERAMIYLPKNSVKITITAIIYENDELVSVSCDLDLSEIRKAFADAEENYIEDEDIFVLTEKGKRSFDEKNI